MSAKSSPAKVSSTPLLSCWLRSEDSKYPSIQLENKETLVLGRQRLTKVKDPRVSRQQIEVTLNLNLQKVEIKQIGANDSGVNGKPIRMGLTVAATQGDTVELCLAGGSSGAFDSSYRYRISFELKSDSPSAATTASKRALEGTGSESASPPPKIPKMFLPKGSAVSIADQFRKDSLLSTKGHWEAIKGDDFFVFSNDESVTEYKRSVAAFDLDGTLIKTKSGKVFPRDEHDWVFRTPSTVPKLQTFFRENPDFKFAIFTNQNGIKNPGDVTGFKRKIELIIRQIGVPALVFVSTKKDKYRKPMTGGWEVFVSQYNQGRSPELSTSFYCGDAAGRIKDHSKSDRLFALNLELMFKTPEEFFEGSRPQSFADPVFCPRKLLNGGSATNTGKSDNSNEHIRFPHSHEMIIMVGMPASGKSSFVKTALLPKGYVHINRDTLKSVPKCLQVAEAAMKEGKSVVIDNTNPTRKDREAFIKLAKDHRYFIRCFRMLVDHMHCLHNNKFRYLVGDLPSTIPDVAFNTFKSNFQEPTPAEGYGEIVPVHFVPEFESDERRSLYKKYLLEK